MKASITNRIPTLDGWRGIAILLVLFDHLQREYLHHFIFGQIWLDLGQHGVTIFFVLSGYLITSKLISSETVDLRAFYIRRFFRILPTALTYLLFLVGLTAFTRVQAIGSDFWYCVLSVRNFSRETALSAFTKHFWSLSIEEQFYLIWPAVIAFSGRRRAIVAAISGALFIAWFRLAHWAYFSAGSRSFYTQARADALLVGCLLALLLDNEPVRQFFTNKSAWLFACALMITSVAIRLNTMLPPLYESVAIAVMIGATSLKPEMVAGRILEMEHLKTTGLLSYSIYIWQGLFFRDIWGVWGLFLLPTSVFASWLLVERPCTELGRRLARPAPAIMAVAGTKMKVAATAAAQECSFSLHAFQRSAEPHNLPAMRLAVQSLSDEREHFGKRLTAISSGSSMQ